jgi:hypothetical protein
MYVVGPHPGGCRQIIDERLDEGASSGISKANSGDRRHSLVFGLAIVDAEFSVEPPSG